MGNFGKRCDHFYQPPGSIIENDRVMSDPSSVAEAFNECFANIVVGESSKEVTDFSKHPSVKSLVAKEVLEDLSFEPVKRGYIRGILC